MAWTNVLFLTLSPLVAVVGVSIYLFYHGLQAGDLWLFFVMLTLSGFAITAGYHRYFSHRTYECHPILQFLYLIFGAAALQNSVLHWASDHRCHHLYTDQERDPYNIKKGFFWAHMGWIFYQYKPDRNFETIPDLKINKLVLWQHRYYMPIGIGIGFVLPTLIGFAYGSPWGGFLVGGLLRAVVLHHTTFLINSAAHWFGRQTYTNKNSARDNGVMAFFTFGEGYHNFHHAFPNDYRNGILFHHWDPAKWWIRLMSWVGMTWRLNRVSEWAIAEAQLRMNLLEVRPLLEKQPAERRQSLQERLDNVARQFETAMARMIQVRQEYRKCLAAKQVATGEEYRRLKSEWRLKKIQCGKALAEARSEYVQFLRELQLRPVLVSS
ncbi:MAG: fatty acid desaturase [Deltaproteobacteria bacterium]|nr:fatty acid desaturase [Deltaproteobacteria bacterium]